MGLRVAVVGATGAVGRIIVRLLEERDFPVQEVKFLASGRSRGATMVFRGRSYPVEEAKPESFYGMDLVLSSTPDEVAGRLLPEALRAGATVVDESAYFRMHDDVPLVVPEVNPDAIQEHHRLIASPNCSTIQLAVALKPLQEAARLRRVLVATYQAASGAGRRAAEELLEQTRDWLQNRPLRAQEFPHPLAFNCIPQIGSPREGGFTSEEVKIVRELRKIFADPNLPVCATCVRVPVANAHSEAVFVETERPLSLSEAQELFRSAPGVVFLDDLPNRRYPMPLEVSGRDEVFVGRLRQDPTHPHGLAFWCVADNLRKGAATNAVQIAELLVQKRLCRARMKD
jgi:aspartate-semialdehyde dehydrogenase